MEDTTMFGGSFGAISAIHHALSTTAPSQRRSHDSLLPYFRQINLFDTEGSSLKIWLANVMAVDQIIIELADKRFEKNDRRKFQSITLVGEAHSQNIRKLSPRSINIKIWSLCKLLQIMYESSVGVYLELSSELDPIKEYENYSAVIEDAIDKNRDFLEAIDNINQHDFKLEFFHHVKTPPKSYLLVLNKKINKHPVIRFDDVISSQNLDNTAYKLLQSKVENNYQARGGVYGVTFVDKRNGALGSFIKYSDLLYMVDYESLNSYGILTFIRFVEGLIKIYDVDSGPNTSFHIKSYLDRYRRDAHVNNNGTFAKLFEYLDETRIFYYNLLIMIYNRSSKYANTNIGMDLVLSATIGDDDVITDLFSKLAETINYNVKDSDVTKTIKATNIFFATNFDCNIKSPRDQECIDILFVVMARIMDYYTIFSIYKNIFDLQNNVYRPDYHIIINGLAHTMFLSHCFRTSNNQQEILYSQSTKADEVSNVCDISNILFPKAQ